jgi:hypothetical protein
MKLQFDQNLPRSLNEVPYSHGPQHSIGSTAYRIVFRLGRHGFSRAPSILPLEMQFFTLGYIRAVLQHVAEQASSPRKTLKIGTIPWYHPQKETDRGAVKSMRRFLQNARFEP